MHIMLLGGAGMAERRAHHPSFITNATDRVSPSALGTESMVSIEKAGHMSSSRRLRSIGSGTVVALGIVGAGVGLLALGRVVGWDATWRTFGVTPLQPPFFDMHVINDYAACAWKGVDAYVPQACNV